MTGLQALGTGSLGAESWGPGQRGWPWPLLHAPTNMEQCKKGVNVKPGDQVSSWLLHSSSSRHLASTLKIANVFHRHGLPQSSVWLHELEVKRYFTKEATGIE